MDRVSRGYKVGCVAMQEKEIRTGKQNPATQNKKYVQMYVEGEI